MQGLISIDNFNQLLNERVPLASTSDDAVAEEESQQQSTATVGGMVNRKVAPQLESFHTTGVGVSWLQHILSSGNDHSDTISSTGRNLLRTVMKEYSIGYFKIEIIEQRCEHEWKFLTQAQENSETKLFMTILSIIQEKIENHNATNEASEESKPLWRFCATNHIIKGCQLKIADDKNILRKMDLPSNLDSANLIYAALIFLSADISLKSEVVRHLLPAMPILCKNEVSPGLENIYPAAFTHFDRNQVDKMNCEEYTKKLNRLEAFFFKSLLDDSDYISRLRVIPRSASSIGITDSHSRIAEEESYLDAGEVKKATRKRRKIEKDSKDPH